MTRKLVMIVVPLILSGGFLIIQRSVDERASVAAGWRLLPASPINLRTSHATVWTGKEMVVWGGYWSDWTTDEWGSANDGAAFNPASNLWRKISPAPVGKRNQMAYAWTGRELVVWGGQDGPDELNDGAAYDPAADRWRTIAVAPIAGGFARSVWTGRELLVWAGSSGAAYRPDSDEWRSIAGPSGRIRSVVWTGTEVLAHSGRSFGIDGRANPGYVAAYSPASNRWEALPKPPEDGGTTTVWTGDEMVVFGSESGVDSGTYGASVAFNPRTRTWRRLSGEVEKLRGNVALWTGRAILTGAASWQESDTSFVEAGRWAAYNPSDGSLQRLPPSPLLPYDSYGAVWTGEELLFWGGQSQRFPQGAAFRLGKETGPAACRMDDVSLSLARSGIGPIEFSARVIPRPGIRCRVTAMVNLRLEGRTGSGGWFNQDVRGVPATTMLFGDLPGRLEARWAWSNWCGPPEGNVAASAQFTGLKGGPTFHEARLSMGRKPACLDPGRASTLRALD